MVSLRAHDGSQLGDRPFVMGILNVTPDSFSDGGQFSGEEAIEHARRMYEEGADIIDIGGESTRPGSDPVSPVEEMSRIEAVLPAVVDMGVPVSIDTTKAEVAAWALDAGAVMVNDVSACRSDLGMAPLVADRGCALILMHMLGMPKDMQDDPQYPGGVIEEITGFFWERMRVVEAAGVDREQLLLDPGIGFGKTVGHNLTILDRLVELKELGPLLLVGASRKWFIGQVSGGDVDDRLAGSVAAAVIAVLGGADIVRVHDVAETVKAVRVAHAITNYEDW
ncbi:MAG: dihydropteroate synthase [Thermoplasmata archaeon]|nr:dihydropteroate synthase [Thermoplasmata archaeon]